MRRRMLALTAVAAAVLGLSGPPFAHAEPFLGGPADPVAMQADQLEVDVATGSAIFTGNVSLAKGDLHVTCPASR